MTETIERQFHTRVTLDQDLYEVYSRIDLEKFIISKEEANNPHFHITYHMEVPVTSKRLEKEYIKIYWQKVFKTLLVGNKLIATSQIQNMEQSIKYTLKDGNYKYKGYTEEYIQQMFKKSYKKTKNKDNVLKEMKIKISEEYLEGRLSFHELKQKTLELYTEYRKPIYMAHLTAHFRSLLFQRNDVIGGLTYQEIIHQQIDRQLGLEFINF